MYPLDIQEKYDQNNLHKLWHRFTTVYLGNYVRWNYEEWVGSHLWVDIVPKEKNQPVRAILDGTVWNAWENSYSGKFIVLEHTNVYDMDMKTRTTLYSCYLHLSAITVSKWQKVKEGDIIGNTGSTWNSTGEHLHFQIDRKEAPFHPYWPFTMKEAKEKNLTFMEATNAGLWIEKAKQYTLNPLVYLNRIEEIKKEAQTSSWNTIPWNTIPQKQQDNLPSETIKTPPSTPTQSNPPIQTVQSTTETSSLYTWKQESSNTPPQTKRQKETVIQKDIEII